MKTAFVLALCAASLQGAVKADLANVAAATTIAVNSPVILRWFRHPKRESKKAAKAAKTLIKGKDK